LDYNEARDDMVAMASSGSYANHLHLTPDSSVKALKAVFIQQKKTKKMTWNWLTTVDLENVH